MAPSHIKLETMADLLSGELHVEEIRTQIVPHLTACCTECRRLITEIRRMQQEVDHWDEATAVREGLEAPELLDELLTMPATERMAKIEEDERLHTWGLCQLLLRRCREEVAEEPAEALALAQLAIRLAEQLPPSAYHPEWVGDLLARAWAHRGNAQRVLGELKAAGADLERAERVFVRSGSGRPWVAAEILDFTASLYRVQRRFAEALRLLDRAEELFRREDDGHRIGRCHLSRAKVLEEMGRVDEAIELLRTTPSMLDAERDPRLLACARHNLLCSLLSANRYAEASKMVDEVREAFGEGAPEADRQRLCWAEGRIAFGLGELAESERLYRAVQRFFLDRRMELDAARVSLDLALVYAEAGRDSDLSELATQLVPLFESRDLGSDVMAALSMFRHSAERRLVTADLVREIISWTTDRCCSRG